VQIVTKSDLVTRDIDLLAAMKAAVAVTVTTLDDSLSLRLEPGAPSPKRRLFALNELSRAGIPLSARIDPIIPGINDCGIEDLVYSLHSAGVRHITSSTYKARPDSIKNHCCLSGGGSGPKSALLPGREIFGQQLSSGGFEKEHSGGCSTPMPIRLASPSPPGREGFAV